MTLALCACLVLLTFGVASAAAQARAQYWIEGRGWGHGIGMSQYGAQGYAEQGWTGEQIIGHYFAGTVVAPRPASGPTSLRVLLQSYLDPARIELTSPGFVQQGSARMELLAGDVVELRSIGAFLVATRVRKGQPNAIVAPATAADATIVPAVDGGVRALFVNDMGRTGTRYRGTLTGTRFGGKVSVVNTVPFETYLRGVVPGEMPSSWHPEALKAQAIAARSYALTTGQRDYAWFDVYSDTRSQVYGGIDVETAATDAAVAKTAGMVARVGKPSGEVAQTFFFSTSAGRTAGNDEVWGSRPYPYLRSVPSPNEAKSPYFVWRGSEIRRLTPAQLGAQLGYRGTFRSVRQTFFASGYVKDVIVNTRGGVKTLRASTVQGRMRPVLRSTFFRIHYLSLGAPNTAAPGATVTISGRAPRTGATFLRIVRAGEGVERIRVRPSGALNQWSVTVPMTSATMTASLQRAGLLGPRIVVRPGA